MSDTDLTAAERAAYAPRWRVRTRFQRPDGTEVSRGWPADSADAARQFAVAEAVATGRVYWVEPIGDQPDGGAL